MYYLTEFPRWLWRVFTKWIWAIGFIPQFLDIISLFPELLDYISTSNPPGNIPSPVINLFQADGDWYLSLALLTIGFLISAFLVHIEEKSKLAAYENHAPDYEFTVTEVTSNLCKNGCHVKVECNLNVKNINPYEGSLARIGVDNESSPIKALGYWEIVRISYLHASIDLPVVIPSPEVDFRVFFRSEINNDSELGQRNIWENAVIPIQLKIEYYNQPSGYVYKLFPFDIQVNLGEEFDSIRKLRERSA